MTVAEFAALSQEEQVRRIEILGRAALAELGLVPELVEQLVHAENTTYKVTSAGKAFCLRVARPGYQSDANVASEILFLAALREAGHDVPRPFGRPIKVSVSEVPEARNCVLLEWQDGEFSKGTTPKQAFEVGRTMAGMHAFSAAWAPAGFDRQRLHDQVFRSMAVELPNSLVSEDDRRLLNEVLAASRAMLASLPEDATQFGLIHGDMHRGNVLFDGGVAKLIDFDDTGWGFWVADLAAALAYEVGKPEFSAVRQGMLAGYESIRPLPPRASELLPQFLRMRFLTVSEWVLQRSDNPSLRETGGAWIEKMCGAIRETVADVG